MSQTSGGDGRGGARATDWQQNGGRVASEWDGTTRPAGASPKSRRTAGRSATSSGVGGRASRANRGAVTSLAGARSLSGPRTRAQCSGAARAARSEYHSIVPSARVPTALTNRRSGKNPCHMGHLIRRTERIATLKAGRCWVVDTHPGPRPATDADRESRGIRPAEAMAAAVACGLRNNVPVEKRSQFFLDRHSEPITRQERV
jgi:hypothetical protein